MRAASDAYRAQDRAAAEALIADDHTFTSPQDDHLDEAAFLERCSPTADRIRSQVLLELVPAAADGVFLLDEYELDDGQRYGNTVGGPRPPHPSQARRRPRDGAVGGAV